MGAAIDHCMAEALQLPGVVDLTLTALVRAVIDENPAAPTQAVRALGCFGRVCMLWSVAAAENDPWRMVAAAIKSSTLERFVCGMSQMELAASKERPLDADPPGLWRTVVRSGCKRPLEITVKISGDEALSAEIRRSLSVKPFLSVAGQTAYEVLFPTVTQSTTAAVQHHVQFELVISGARECVETLDCTPWLGSASSSCDLEWEAARIVHQIVQVGDKVLDEQIKTVLSNQRVGLFNGF